jgi:hypothetical protein
MVLGTVILFAFCVYRTDSSQVITSVVVVVVVVVLIRPSISR